MKRFRKGSKKPIVNAVLNIGLSVLTGISLTALTAKLVHAGTLPMKWGSTAVFLIQGVAAIVGCLCTALRSNEKRLLYTAITGCGYLLLLCLLSGAFFGGDFQNLLPTIAIVGAAILISLILAAQIKKPGYRGVV